MMSVRFWKWPLAGRILLGFFAGAVAGMIARSHADPTVLSYVIGQVVAPLGGLFLRIIIMVVVPVIFSAIVLGIMGTGGPHQLGRAGLRTLAWIVILGVISVAVAIGLTDAIHPGRHLSEAKRAALVADYRPAGPLVLPGGIAKKPALIGALIEMIPENPFAAAASAFQSGGTGGGMLAIMVFSLFVGVAATMVPPGQAEVLQNLCTSVFAVCMRIIGFAMTLAPFCVMCLGFVTAARLGAGMFSTLGIYVATVLLGLLIQGIGVYSVVLAVWARRSPLRFFRESREATVMAFSTASSFATLPVALKVAENELRLSPAISRFVLTLGAAMNHNGTALYEAATVFFLAQLFGIELTAWLQIKIALMCMLASIGAGGVPGGGLAMTIGVLTAVGVPSEAIAIVLGVDRILDMSRTALNVSGYLVIAAVVDCPTGGLKAAECATP
jgi:dicarboxylate/amino acid:cation (Na+ or H+) symporter, DAACS family